MTLALLALCGLLCAGQSGQDEPTGAVQVRRLPNLFDFERFKQLFSKSYSSLMEELARRRIYLARAFNVFLAAIAYKRGSRSHYLSINHLSDWTPDELDSMLMKERVRFAPDGTEELPNVKVKQEEEVLMVDKEELEDKFAEIVNKQDEEPVYKEIAQELKADASQNRSKRNAVYSARRRNLDLAQLMRAPENGKVSVQEEGVVLESNNPNYEEPEMTSFGAGDENEGKDSAESIWSRVRSSGAGALGQMLNAGKEYIINQLSGGIGTYDHLEVNPELEDEMFIDHRSTRRKCYFEPRDQGRCGSCWAFSTTALYEWHYCMLTDIPVAFSEQYLVDCGRAINRRIWKELDGCQGGMPEFVSKFVDNFGIELRKHYPYVYRQNECAYNLNNPESAKRAGFIRLSHQEFEMVSVKDIEKYLQMGPMVMNFHTTGDFSFYAGGVDDAVDCNPNKHHSMLLVGSGREEGKEYWLVRNSYSTHWGERGHWKLSKKATRRCMDDWHAMRLKDMQIGEILDEFEPLPINRRRRPNRKIYYDELN